MSSALLFHQRSQSMRSHSIGHSRSSLHSPLTPPSPSADFSMIHPQFSPPSPSVALTSKPASSQPISISLQRQTYTPRGSPHTGISALNLSRMATDTDEYVLHHTRYSPSPSRVLADLCLCPLYHLYRRFCSTRQLSPWLKRRVAGIQPLRKSKMVI